jgi:hypothetical protein
LSGVGGPANAPRNIAFSLSWDLAMSEPEPEIDLAEHIKLLQDNVASASALVTVAIVNDWLLQLLLASMCPLSNKQSERMFGSYGPLYEVAPKADMAYAFRLIDADTLAALRALNAIRNYFAHTRDMENFTTPEVINLCRSLPGWKEGCDAHVLFEDVAVDCVRKIDAKMTKIAIYQAVKVGKKAEPSPDKPE